MEVLTSFAINIAAGIALDMYKKANSGVQREINIAFNKALKDWSKNDAIRNRNESRFKIVLKDYIQNPDYFKEKEFSKIEISSFFNYFNKRIAEYQSAYNYLQNIIDERRYSEIKELLSESKKAIFKIYENTNFDPRDIGEEINNLPFEKGKEEVDKIIQNRYKNYKIDSNVKEVLLLFVEKIYEKITELQREIDNLKSSGNSEQACVFLKIKSAIENRKPEKLYKI